MVAEMIDIRYNPGTIWAVAFERCIASKCTGKESWDYADSVVQAFHDESKRRDKERFDTVNDPLLLAILNYSPRLAPGRNMNYSTNTAMCRVEFFRETGKWYTTESLVLNYSHPKGPIGALLQACDEQLEGRLKGMWAVCFDPYHEHGYPVMVKVGDLTDTPG
jgi:hypothetical protein